MVSTARWKYCRPDATETHATKTPVDTTLARLISVQHRLLHTKMKIHHQLLAVQLITLIITFVGEATGVWALVAIGVAGFFLALAALFVQMTADLVTGVHRDDRRSTVR
jgi:hypothetical protein